MNFQEGVISQWTKDTQHFLLENFDTIHNSPSHIYHSALPFSPSSSWLQKCYGPKLSPMVKVVKGLPTKWGVCSRTVLLDSPIYALSFQNNRIAVGSFSKDIAILDAITGSQTAILSGHTLPVWSLVFSSDGTSLVSGSSDKTVKLWDLQTGGVIKTFSGHTQCVQSVSISADSTTIASGSLDGSIRLWNIQTGECYQAIEQQQGVKYVSFSPTDNQHLVSICDGKVWQWNADGHQVKPPYDGDGIAFSSAGTQSISCNGEVTRLQNIDSGVIVAVFHTVATVSYQSKSCCCFSPDGRLVAFAADNTAYVWDITSSNPHLVETFIGHTSIISSLVFSSSSTLISASWDKSVKFWQIDASSAEPVVAVPIASPMITSVSLQARDGIAISSDADGVVKAWDISADLCKTPSKISAKDGKHRDIDSRLLYVWYADEKINILDAKKGELLLQADMPKDNVVDLRISRDGSKVFCICRTFTQAWDIWTGGVVGREEYGDLAGVGLLAMGGSKVWVWAKALAIEYMGWDFGAPGSSTVKLRTAPPNELHLSDTKLWYTNPCRIEDTVTGRVVLWLPLQFGNSVDMHCDGQYLVVCFRSREVTLEFHPTFLQ